MRKITSLILHCSATPEGKDYTVADIDRWHKARGFKSPSGIHVGYHFIVYRDGTVMQGRPVEEVGAHAGSEHNPHSIGICYIGGLYKDGKAKDTRTPQQKDSLLDLCFLFLQHYNLTPDAIHCHNEFANKACPSFSRDTFIQEFNAAFPSTQTIKREIKLNIKL